MLLHVCLQIVSFIVKVSFTYVLFTQWPGSFVPKVEGESHVSQPRSQFIPFFFEMAVSLSLNRHFEKTQKTSVAHTRSRIVN